MAEFAPPEEFIGQSLSDLRSKRDEPFRADVLANILGISEQAPFQQGQIFDVGQVNPGSAEFQFLQSAFRPGGEVREQRLQERAAEAVRPAVQTLREGIDPLKDRYNKVIESIKGREEQTIGESDVATTREFAKRGLLPSSGAVQDVLGRRREDIRTRFGGLEAQTGLQAQQAEQSIMNAIAQLQATAGMSGFEAANAVDQAMRVLQEQQRQFDISTQLEKEQLEQQGQQFQQQLEQPSTTIQTIGGRKVLLALDPSGNIVNQQDLGPSTSSGDSGLANILQTIFGGGLPGGGGQSTNKPQFSPQKGAGATRGNWYFDGSEWIPIVD